MAVRVVQPFAYAYDGWRVVDFAEGQEVPDHDPAAAVALREGWAVAATVEPETQAPEPAEPPAEAPRPRARNRRG